ncbi:basement membrane-specific heparan sulfate proteoglycan core protein-like [Vipera latastei]
MLGGRALVAAVCAAAVLSVAQASSRLDEATFPEDTESEITHWLRKGYDSTFDDEDLMAGGPSGDENGSGENGSGIVSAESPQDLFSTDFPSPPAPPPPSLLPSPAGPPAPAHLAAPEPDDESPLIYFRAQVNFTHSFAYSHRLEDVNSEAFQEVSEAVVDTLESEYIKIPGEQSVSVVFIKEVDGYVFVELDVGSEGNADEGQIREVLFSVVASGSIASYRTSRKGFQFRRLGAAQTPPPPISEAPPAAGCSAPETEEGEEEEEEEEEKAGLLSFSAQILSGAGGPPTPFILHTYPSLPPSPKHFQASLHPSLRCLPASVEHVDLGL